MALNWNFLRELTSPKAIKDLNDFMSKAAKMINRMELPIGFIVSIKDDSRNPSEILGYGTWERITDKFLYACTDSGDYSAGKTGGGKTSAISKTHLPNIRLNVGYQGGNNISLNTGGGQNYNIPYGSNGVGGELRTEILGDGTGLPIMPPFISVYVWERTA